MYKIFPVGVPVTGENLIGRKKEIEEIGRSLEIGQSVIITAPRKYGKTSLIFEILNQSKTKGYFTGLVDVFGVLTKREFAERIIDSVLVNKRIRHAIKRVKENIVNAMKSMELKQVVQDFEFILGFSNYQIDEEALLDEALDFPEKFARKYDKRIILAFDEFGDICKLDGEALMKKMRSKFQLHQNVTYIFSGSQETLMKDLFTKRESAFFRFGRVFYLSGLPKADFKSYIIRSFNQEGIKIDESCVDDLLYKTDGHPYYTQLVCQLCYLNVKKGEERVSTREMEEAYKKAILLERPYFEEMEISLMENRYQLLLVRQLLHDERSAYKVKGIDKQYIYKLIIALQKKGVIKRIEKGKYTLTDPLFKSYLDLRNEE